MLADKLCHKLLYTPYFNTLLMLDSALTLTKTCSIVYAIGEESANLYRIYMY